MASGPSGTGHDTARRFDCGLHQWDGDERCPVCVQMDGPADAPVAVPGPAFVSPAEPRKVPCPECDRMEPTPGCDVCADPVVSPADTIRRDELIERLRGAANYEFGNLNEDQRNLYREAADAIESRNALLHGADVDHAALLAVGERDKAELAEIHRAAEQMIREGCTAPSPEAFAYLASLRDRHVDQIKALNKRRLRDRQRITQLTEALNEITEARESFGDDRIYANHAERVAYNALNRDPAVLAVEEDAAT